jgi:hypothetical protein
MERYRIPVERIAREVTEVEIVASSREEAEQLAQRDARGPQQHLTQPWHVDGAMASTAQVIKEAA